MTQKERHFEFMKACIQGLLPKLPLVDQMGEHGIKVPDKNVYNHEVMQSCVALADAALAEFDKRWPEEHLKVVEHSHEYIGPPVRPGSVVMCSICNEIIA